MRSNTFFFGLVLMAALLAPWAFHAHATNDIRVVGLFQDKAVVVVDGQRHVLTVGERSPEGIALVQVTAQGAVLEQNGYQRSYPLGDRVGTRFSRPEVERITVYRNPKGMFTTTGVINGLSVPFLIDTGASAVAMSVPQAKRLGIAYALNGKKVSVQTASGLARAYRVTLPVVKLGNVLQRNVDAFVVEAETPDFVLLGMSYLQRFNIVNEGHVMHLDKKY